MRIAYLEDDQEQADLLMAWMEEDGHQYQHFQHGNQFINRVSKDSFDCIILDWEIPDLTGFEVLHWIRNNYDTSVPVIFVTQRQEESDIIEALEAGADDYLVKPLRKGEFLARLKALHRRSVDASDTGSNQKDIVPFKIDPVKEEIVMNDEQVPLTKKEYDLAVLLFNNTGRVISRNHIMESVWSNYSDINTRTIDTHISRIRTKLFSQDENSWCLRSIYMHGYRLDQY